jgi:hypothetical protein
LGVLNSIKEYFRNREQKKIERNLAIIKNPKAIREERWAALEYIGSLEDPEVAVLGLMQRYSFSLEHGINDTKEKELVMENILRFEQAAIPFLTEQLSKSDRIAWPLKILYKLGSEAQIVEALQKALCFEDVSFDRASVDKNYDILCYLRDHSLDNYTKELSHFVTDPDERVRFAAVEALIEQKDSNIPELLEGFLSDETSENRRIRKSVVDAFVRQGWGIKNTDVFSSELVVEGVFLTKNKTLEARSGARHD